MAKVILPEGTAAATPAAGTVVFYAKTDGLLYSKDDAGTETPLGSSGSGNVATDAIWDAKGDIAVGTGANTAIRVAAGSNGLVLTADSAEASGLKWASVAGTGDVVGPAASTNNSMVLYDGTTGKLLKDGIAPGTGIATALAVNVGTAGAPVVNGGALGTPSSGTLTNATGLPVAGITASTSTALGVGSIELGHASDTTLTRVSAGVAAVEGKTIAMLSAAETFTAPQRGTITTDNDASFDQSVTNNWLCTPTAGGALTFTSMAEGQSGYIKLVNGSNYAITAAATTKVTSTFLATISVTGTYIVSYYSDGTNTYCATAGAMA